MKKPQAEVEERLKILTEVRMTLGHLCVLQAVMVEHGKGADEGLADHISLLTQYISNSRNGVDT